MMLTVYSGFWILRPDQRVAKHQTNYNGGHSVLDGTRSGH